MAEELTTKEATLADKIADGFAAADEVAETAEARLEQRIWQLITTPTERNADIWTAAEANLHATLEDFHSTPVAQRDETWSIMMARMASAAQEQAFVEIMARDLLQQSHDERAKVREASGGFSKAEIRTLGQKSVGRARFEQAKDRRRGQAAATD